jgi:hypothetical protein
MTKRRLQRAFDKLDVMKKTRDPEVPGILGFTVNGINTVEVGNRSGFVWVRLRNNSNEVIQAYNDQVSPVYGLPVVVVRDEIDRTKYKIKGKDLGVYQNWNNTPYLPRHGNQHSFNPEAGGGGDVAFIYNRQFMPLAVHPSGSAGGGNVYVQPYAYYQGTQWKYAGGTGTASLLPYKPTGTSARMVLVYLDSDGNPNLLGGDTYFASSITGNAAVLPYVPSLSATTDIPLAAIRLVSGTNNLVWDNIYDLRPIIVSDGFIPTGSVGHTIQDDGTPFANRDALNFVGSNFVVYNTAGATNVSGTFVGGISQLAIPVYEDGVFRVTGTVLDFTTNMNVAVTGSVAYISSTGGGTGSSGAPTDAKYVVSADHADLSAEITIPGMAAHADRKGAGATGTISQEYDTATTGLTWNVAPAAEDSNTTLPSHLYVRNTSAVERYGLMDWTAPGSGSFDARCKISLSTDTTSASPSFGLLIADSGATNRLLLNFLYSNGNIAHQVAGYTYAGSYSLVDAYTYYDTYVYLRITRNNSSVVKFYCSSDGIGWHLVASTTFGFVCASIGFRTVVTNNEAYVDWLRAQP